MVAAVVLARYRRSPLALGVTYHAPTWWLRSAGWARGPLLWTPCGSPTDPLGFAVLVLDFELDRGGFEAQHPLVHAPLHFLGGTDKAHEVDRLGTAAQAEA